MYTPFLDKNEKSLFKQNIEFLKIFNAKIKLLVI